MGMRSLAVVAAVLLTASLADASDADRVVRRSFVCDAEASAVRDAACSLEPRGRSHTFAVRVGDETCGGRSTTDDVVIVVRLERRADGRPEVVVEAQSADAASDDEVTATVDRTARALESVLTAPVAEPRVKGPWYGWQIILGTIAVDAAGTAGVIAVDGASQGQTAPLVVTAVVAVSARVFLGPVIHVLQHESDAAAWSVGLELGLPIATALTALGLAAIASNGRVEYPLNALAFGAAPGAFVATVIDAAALSTKHVAPKKKRPVFGWAIVPAVGSTHAGLDVVAAF
jgi:hypothetical protein